MARNMDMMKRLITEKMARPMRTYGRQNNYILNLKDVGKWLARHRVWPISD